MDEPEPFAAAPAGLPGAVRRLVRGLEACNALLFDAQDVFSGFDDKISRVVEKSRLLERSLRQLSLADNEGHDDAIQVIVKDGSDALACLEGLIAGAGVDAADPAAAKRMAESTWKLNESDVQHLIRQLDDGRSSVQQYFEMRRFQSKYYSSDGAMALAGGRASANLRDSGIPDQATIVAGSISDAQSISTAAPSLADSDLASEVASVEFGFDDDLQSSLVYQNMRDRLSPPHMGRFAGVPPRGSSRQDADANPSIIASSGILSPRSLGSARRPASSTLSEALRARDRPTDHRPSASEVLERESDRTAFRERAAHRFSDARQDQSILQLRPAIGVPNDDDDDDGSSTSTETGRRSEPQERVGSDPGAARARAASSRLGLRILPRGSSPGRSYDEARSAPIVSSPSEDSSHPASTRSFARLTKKHGSGSSPESSTRPDSSGDPGTSDSQGRPPSTAKRKLLPRWPKLSSKNKGAKDANPSPPLSSPPKSAHSVESPRQIEYQLVAIGTSEAATSALTTKFMQDQFADGDDTATLRDMRPRPIPVDGEPVLLDIVACSAGEEFSATTSHAITTGDAFLLVYSVGSRSSFDEIARFQKEILSVKRSQSASRAGERMTVRQGRILRPKGLDSFPLILVGSNCVAAGAEDREVETEVGIELARSYDCPFVEVDVDEEVNTDEAFFELVREIRRHEEDTRRNRNKLVPSVVPETEKPREWLQPPKPDPAKEKVRVGLEQAGMLPRRSHHS